jgi:uncharacterized membrane protein
MPDESGNRPEKKSDNLFKIIDGTVSQIDKTKKIFLIVLIGIAVIPPVTLVLTTISSPPNEHGPGGPGGIAGTLSFLFSTRNVPLIVSLAALVIGIWQWFALTKWTKRYRRYKKLQREIDEEVLGDRNDDDSSPDK